MKNERGSDFFFFHLQKSMAGKKIANFVLLSAAKGFLLRICGGRGAALQQTLLLLPNRKSLSHHFPPLLKDELRRPNIAGEGTEPYSGRGSDENCFWIWLWSLENCSNDFWVRLFLLSLRVTSIRYSCRSTGKNQKMEIKLATDPKTCF